MRLRFCQRKKFMRFLVDENLPFSLTKLLRNLGHNVLDVVEANLRGSPDEKLWQIAAKEKRVLVTRDLGFPLLASYPLPLGIILVRVPDTFTSSLITNLLDNSLKTIKSEELEGHITVISPGKVRFRKLHHEQQ